MKNKDRGEGGGLINFPPLKRGGGLIREGDLFERGGLNRGFTVKGHVEVGYLTKFGTLKLNRDQVMTLETWLKICNFVTASPNTI